MQIDGARRARRGRRAGALAVVAALALVAGACSEDEPTPSGAAGTSGATAAPAAPAPAPAPDGPVADLSEELTGGAGAPFIGAAPGTGLPDGYVEQELVAAGTATDYAVVGEQGGDGRWTFEPDTSAEYRTRVLIRRPADPADASGTVIVEWLNVSGGLDANPDWTSLSEEIIRQGHTWVGVSAQLIGVEGGPVLVTVAAPEAESVVGEGLVAIDPERYGSLDHPGDGYAFDVFTQVARAVRAGGPALGGQVPDVVLAAGESQSAIALTTYYNGVQPLTDAFDGFFVHSRASVSLPLVGPGGYADLAGAMTDSGPVLLRDDLAAPVLELQAEGDVVGVLSSALARQPDSATFRLWEVAGTAHADANLLGSMAEAIDCGAPINDGPLHVVAKAALRALDTWVRTGEAPPEAPLLDLADGGALVRDADGIATGGIRTPPVDVPVVVLSGEPGPTPDVICLLLGSTTPLPPPDPAERYGSAEAYEAEFDAAADAAIAAGFVLEEDREALTGFAQPELVGG